MDEVEKILSKQAENLRVLAKAVSDTTQDWDSFQVMAAIPLREAFHAGEIAMRTWMRSQESAKADEIARPATSRGQR